MKTLSAAFVAAAFCLLLSAPLRADENKEETPDEGTEVVVEGEASPEPEPDAPSPPATRTLESVLDEAKRLVDGMMKGVVRSDDPRLAEIERQLRLLAQKPPRRPAPQTRTHARPTVPAPNFPKPNNGHVGTPTPGHGEVEHLILEAWGVCRQLRALQGGVQENKDELLVLQKRLAGVNRALEKFDERLTDEKKERQNDDATLAVSILLLFGAGLFFIGITHNHQGD